MKIGALVKQVPAKDSAIAIRPDGQWIEEEGLEFETCEPDDYALEVCVDRLCCLRGRTRDTM
ncbi:MAG: hypothetical protein KJO54_01450 [Gammaproteobacteria bacterium]|nr:hypothetical protein [Gammaproteobacteria bacterium]NNF60473.1 hypothetical protein [Gammaproteobacteria bacterium]